MDPGPDPGGVPGRSCPGDRRFRAQRTRERDTNPTSRIHNPDQFHQDIHTHFKNS